MTRRFYAEVAEVRVLWKILSVSVVIDQDSLFCQRAVHALLLEVPVDALLRCFYRLSLVRRGHSLKWLSIQKTHTGVSEYALKQLADSWKILDSQHGKSRQENLIKLSGHLEIPHTHIFTNICMPLLTATWPVFMRMSRFDLKVCPGNFQIFSAYTLETKAERQNLKLLWNPNWQFLFLSNQCYLMTNLYDFARVIKRWLI